MRPNAFLAVMLWAVAVPLSAPVSADQPKSLTITVIDAQTDQPLTEVAVTAHRDDGQQQLRPDRVGRIVISRVDQVKRALFIRFRHDDYVSVALLWQARNGAAAEIPAEYTLRLQRGMPIGGRVVDDAGDPVAGAGVSIHIVDRNTGSPEQLDIRYEQVKTDENGVWTYPTAPAEFDEAYVGAYHHDFVTRAYYPMLKTDPAALRDRTATITLERGVMVEGVVTDLYDQPVGGARVGVGEDRVASNVTPEIVTDPDGRFRFTAKPGEPVVITVKHRNHAPELVSFTMPPTPHSVKIALEPPATIRGRVVNTAGDPIANAWIFVDGWRGHRTITHRTQTDADGRFVWANAPADDVRADIAASGYHRKNAVMLASADENRIILQPPTTVRGVVLDAETDEPIASFRIIRGISGGQNDAVTWVRDQEPDNERYQGRDGAFEFEITWPYPGHAVRIEADGYIPAESRIFSPDEDEVVLAFAMKKGKSITGVVRDAQGNPVQGATVVVMRAGTFVMVANGIIEPHTLRNHISATTTADGRFTLPPQTGNYEIFALAKAGTALVTADELATATDITLSPWGSVRGVARIGTHPAANARIVAGFIREHDPSRPNVMARSTTTANADGEFTIEHVLPGLNNVARAISVSSYESAYASSTKVEVEAGKTATVQVGGVGRPVVGRIVLPDELSQTAWVSQFSNISTKVDLPKLPEETESMSREELQQWFSKWQQTPDGQAFRQAREAANRQSRFIEVMVKADGTFRADDVPPGVYQIRIVLRAPLSPAMSGDIKVLATGEGEFTIDPVPGGVTDDPLELPPITAKLADSETGT